jgi:hypothetical protein
MKFVRLGMAGLFALALLGSTAGAAAGASPGRAPQASGTCSGSSTWDLTLTLDVGLIEAHLQVFSAVGNESWKVVMNDNGARFFKRVRMSDAEGHLDVDRKTANQAGTDTVIAKATNLTTGEVCKAKATI